MSQTTLSCKLSVKIDFSLDSDSKYQKDQEKRDCIFLKVPKRSKMAKYKMTTKVYKNKYIYE